MVQNEKIREQLTKINTLLRDSNFTQQLADSLETAYYTAEKKAAPVFSIHDEKVIIEKSIKQEKIATGLAPFYALECGVSQLMETYGGTPLDWLTKITEEGLENIQILLLNDFANATWKAGQPFRGLERITNDIFISSIFLSEEEIDKDYEHILGTATLLKSKMEDLKDTSRQLQLRRISDLLQDEEFAFEVAQNSEAIYYVLHKHPAPVFLTDEDDIKTLKKTAINEKIATNIAGFYALESGLSYLAAAKNAIPSYTLQSIINNSIDVADKKLFERFSNATWKAGQPFRGLDRITRDNFTCFDLLSKDDINKSTVQIKTAAVKLATFLN